MTKVCLWKEVIFYLKLLKTFLASLEFQVDEGVELVIY